MSVYLVVDLEATCSDDETVPRAEMEIIEIGAVLAELAEDGEVRPRGEFQTFVKPVRHPRLTAFCCELTGITQAEVDAAPGLAEALAALRHWLHAAPREHAFLSWGDYDRKQIAQDCAFHDLPFPIAARHSNAKELFRMAQGLKKRSGISGALALAGLKFDGRPHRAIDDARNIARLLPYVLGTRRIRA